MVSFCEPLIQTTHKSTAALSAVPPLALRFNADFVCKRREGRFGALFTECRPAAFCECRKSSLSRTADSGH